MRHDFLFAYQVKCDIDTCRVAVGGGGPYINSQEGLTIEIIES